MSKEASYYSEQLKKTLQTMGRVILGKEESILLILLSLISGGHVLIEDIPGVGKTSLVSALSRAVSCQFKRIQFTPDIMPSDVTGFSLYNQKTGEFEFRPGAVMSNFVLADEINRASAKTQASLLEVMEEKQVTIDSVTHVLKEPFMVLATQNPLDNLGTYPLPEAQIDRFQIKVSLGYPSYEEEVRIMAMTNQEKVNIPAIVTGEEIMEMRKKAVEIKVEESLRLYIADIVTATRKHEMILLGASPRGSISLFRMSQALALYEGREYVIPDDVKRLAPYVLSHRLILNQEAKIQKIRAEVIMKEILDKTPLPLAKTKYSRNERT